MAAVYAISGESGGTRGKREVESEPVTKVGGPASNAPETCGVARSPAVRDRERGPLLRLTHARTQRRARASFLILNGAVSTSVGEGCSSSWMRGHDVLLLLLFCFTPLGACGLTSGSPRTP
jgi:hypothetical protein